MDLIKASEVLECANIKHKLVVASEVKDTTAPYTRKRYLTSLNDMRLRKVLSILDACQGSANIDRLIKDAKEYDAKDASDMILHFSAEYDNYNERLRDLEDIITGLLGVNTGLCGHVARTLRSYVKNGSFMKDPVGTSVEALKIVKEAQKKIDAVRNKVLKEAKKRGLKLDAGF